LPPNPRQIPQTIVLFPVPFGPIIIFKWGPGWNSAASYVTKFDNLILKILPGKYSPKDVNPLTPFLKKPKIRII